MKLSIVIVNYNVRYFLEQALLSVRRAVQHLEADVWVVDNNSVDDSVAMVREKFPEVHLIANKGNTGFAKANNQAIRLSQGEYVLLLNPDTVVEENTFTKCVQYMDAHPNVGGLGVRMIDGTGKFLPESKRGFPTPWVAFCKTVGLSALFPKSKRFNHYYMGYLDERETNEVEVLAGAFMLMRHAVLDTIGLLDETFFMYGEDIDLSYRILQGGYQNVYFPETTIIHYKGESTKKGSLNYVRTFYQAMIIFARKHFRGNQARLFVLMLQAAIYFRAFITLIAGFFEKTYISLLDAAVMWVGLAVSSRFWAVYYFHDPHYYDDAKLYFHFPLYITFWLLGIYFNGGYEAPFQLRRLVRGLAIGTVLLAALYGFLDLSYRPSRALILLGAMWAAVAAIIIRIGIHLLRFGNWNIGRERPKNLVIVGSTEESKRVEALLHQAQVHKNRIGIIAPTDGLNDQYYLGSLSQLPEIVHIYKVEEIIFCSKDLSSQDIISWMTRLGPLIDYKIVPEESLSVIGSHSKNTAGELYTIEIRFNIAGPAGRRNKRLFDWGLSLFLLTTLPFHLLFVKNRWGLIRNLALVMIGKISWVGYAAAHREEVNLPPLLPGVLTPLDGLQLASVDSELTRRLNFFYAKDYDQARDWDICWKGYPWLGRDAILLNR